MAGNVDTLDFFGRLEGRLATAAVMLDAQDKRLDRLAPYDPVPAELCNELAALRVDVAAAVDELRKLARHVAAVELLTIPAAALAQQLAADRIKTANVLEDRRAVDSRQAGQMWPDMADDTPDSDLVLRRRAVVGVPENVQPAAGVVPATDREAEALAKALQAAGRPDLADAELQRAGLITNATVMMGADGFQRAGTPAPAVDLSALPGLRDMAEDLAAHLGSHWGSSDLDVTQANELARQLRQMVDAANGQPITTATTDAEPASGAIARRLLELRGQGRLIDARELIGSDLFDMAELQAQALANLANAPALVALDTLDELAARGQAMLGRLRRLVDTDARRHQLAERTLVLGPAYPEALG